MSGIGDSAQRRDVRSKVREPTMVEAPNLYRAPPLWNRFRMWRSPAPSRGPTPHMGNLTPRLHELGTDVLCALLDRDVSTVTSLDVKTRVDRIEVLERINDEDEDGFVFLVEDKVETDEHSSRIEH